MAKAHADTLQHIFNKLGAWVQPRLPHMRVHTSTPTPEVDDEVIEAICNAVGSRHMHLTQGLMYDSSSVTAWLRSHATIVGQGTVDLTVANTAYQLTAADTPCDLVLLSGVGTGPIIHGKSDITTAGAIVPIGNVVPLPIRIINANLIYLASANAGDDGMFTAYRL